MENTFAIGTQTQLSNEMWRAEFLATLDEGDLTHESFMFIKSNRYAGDSEDEVLEGYSQWCKEQGYEF
ncbi:hypothetical protein M5G27_07255 [Pseudomonas shahriarae]|uniref:Uncharacterized protein n=1 Tax=Pseudomonas shahriarae TaxID=2745512 RepID=A0A9X4HBS4_9PSED|nr:hypothetical protein [Pseudomonas shahriarae]MDD1007277.1 hypothetical protein [Pseudomonas shahriarae]